MLFIILIILASVSLTCLVKGGLDKQTRKTRICIALPEYLVNFRYESDKITYWKSSPGSP